VNPAASYYLRERERERETPTKTFIISLVGLQATLIFHLSLWVSPQQTDGSERGKGGEDNITSTNMSDAQVSTIHRKYFTDGETNFLH
jgi:hypothetical protein